MDASYQAAIRAELSGIIKEETALKQTLSRLRYQLREVEGTLNKYRGAEVVLGRLQKQFTVPTSYVPPASQPMSHPMQAPTQPVQAPTPVPQSVSQPMQAPTQPMQAPTQPMQAPQPVAQAPVAAT